MDAGTRCHLDLVAARINEAAGAAGRRPVAGIDGPGGSGKSTLAGLLADLLPGASVVQVDDFYLPSSERLAEEAAIAPNFDLERLRTQVLEPATAGRETRYQRYDWDRDVLGEWVTLPATGPVIVEGIYCTRDDLREYYTYRIFCTVRRDIRLRRGLLRDGEEARHLWVDVWMPAEDRYLAAQRPHERANLVLDGSARDAAAGTEFVIGGPI